MGIKVRKYLSLVPMLGFLINMIYLTNALAERKISFFSRGAMMLKLLGAIITFVALRAGLMFLSLEPILDTIAFCALIWLLFTALALITVAEEEKVRDGD
jgi:uncharacterized membrane protein